MKADSFLDIAKCKNCKNFANGICLIRTDERTGKPLKVSSDDTCSVFDESIEYLSVQEILKDPDIFNKITEDEFDKKIVGEKETRKVIFLCAAGGRLVENCQTASYNLLVNDDAGTGKDYITGNVLSILPKDCYIHKTRISPTTFTYWHTPQKEPEWTWDGKVFYPEDISEVVLNSDVFKVMCSNGSNATIVIKQEAVDIEIRGKPVMITTTATATPNPELTRRFVILNLDSSENQTKAIMDRHAHYKQTGIVPEYNKDYTEAIKQLKRVKVIIPFATLISSYFPTKNIIMRTHFPRFMDYIAASAAFHQYQREVDQQGFVLAQGKDYDIARSCFLKLCSNKYMIPLTSTQKQILAVFEDDPATNGSASWLHAHIFSKLGTLVTIQKQLDNLVKYGLLQTSTAKDSLNREIEVYKLSESYNPNERLEIPTYEELCRNTKVSKPSIITKTSIITKVTSENSQKEGVTLDTLDIIVPKGLNNAIKLEQAKVLKDFMTDQEIKEALA